MGTRLRPQKENTSLKVFGNYQNLMKNQIRDITYSRM